MTLLAIATAYLVSSIGFSTYSAIFTWKHWTLRCRERQYTDDMTALLKQTEVWRMRAEYSERKYKEALTQGKI